MAKLQNKNIILGICGSISAYKTPNLVRLLKKEDFDVQCVITESSKKFVSDLTLSNLSKKKVISDLFDRDYSEDGAWHVKLAHDVSVCLIAPCSATTIGKLANGICDNALTTLVCALPKNIKKIIYPAMDYTMWENPAVQENISRLRSFGYDVQEPEVGELSSGLWGAGRLVEESKIVSYLLQNFNNENRNELNKKKDSYNDYKNKIKIDSELDYELLKSEMSKLRGKKCLITLGPTVEKIDDVRYLSNHSSGKMGFELAKEAKFRGMEVTLVNGPVDLDFEDIKNYGVTSADEMYNKVMDLKDDNDLIIMTAAVADYKVENPFNGKIKKEGNDNFNISLIKNKDILKSLGNSKNKNQILVGFALETNNEKENAIKKLNEKNADLIILNSYSTDNRVFGNDFNKISIVSKNNISDFDKKTKRECAKLILNKVEELITSN